MPPKTNKSTATSVVGSSLSASSSSLNEKSTPCIERRCWSNVNRQRLKDLLLIFRKGHVVLNSNPKNSGFLLYFFFKPSPSLALGSASASASASASVKSSTSSTSNKTWKYWTRFEHGVDCKLVSAEKEAPPSNLYLTFSCSDFHAALFDDTLASLTPTALAPITKKKIKSQPPNIWLQIKKLSADKAVAEIGVGEKECEKWISIPSTLHDSFPFPNSTINITTGLTHTLHAYLKHPSVMGHDLQMMTMVNPQQTLLSIAAPSKLTLKSELTSSSVWFRGNSGSSTIVYSSGGGSDRHFKITHSPDWKKDEKKDMSKTFKPFPKSVTELFMQATSVEWTLGDSFVRCDFWKALSSPSSSSSPSASKKQTLFFRAHLDL